MSGNRGDGGDRSDGWWLSGSHVFLVFLLYAMYIYVMQKIFYNTMKCKKMNEWYFLNFYASTINISYVFSIKIIYMGLEFYNAMMRTFIL